jgi:tetratricopeptide (TPR) repeat protein
VDAAFQASYELLSADFRDRWCKLSTFPGSFDLNAVSVIWGSLIYPTDEAGLVMGHAANTDETQNCLQILVNFNLVEWNDLSKRFRLHSLVRRFCDAKLTPLDRVEARYRFSAYYCKVLQRAKDLYNSGGEESILGIAIFDSELNNIGYGHGWAIDSFRSVDFLKNYPQFRRSVAVACSAYPCIGASLFSLRLSPQVRISIGDVGLRAAKEIGDQVAEGSHLGNIGVGYVQLGEYQKAISFFKQRFAIAHQQGDFEGQCNALGNLAGAFSNLGEYEVAKDYCNQELDLRRARGDRQGEGVALCSLGSIYAASGRDDIAIGFYLHQLQICREGEYLHDEAVALICLGKSYRIVGKTGEAIECLERGLTICRRLRDVKSEGEALTGLANVYVWVDEPEMAIEIYEQAITCKQAIGDVRGVGQTLGNIARAYLELKDFENCLLNAAASLRICEQIHAPETHKMREIVSSIKKAGYTAKTSSDNDRTTVTDVYYYSYHVKMKDLRGGFPGFLSNWKPDIVDGMAHLLVANKARYTDEQIQNLISMSGDTVLERHASRPFSVKECANLPEKLNIQLLKGGHCITAIPHFSSHIRPFRNDS